MKGQSPNPDDQNLFKQRLKELLNPHHDLYKLAQKMDWDHFEQQLSPFYHKTGRPSKPIRLMTGLLILKQMYEVSDEEVCKHWVQNPYWQFFCGEVFFQWKLPCDPSDLVYFRKRIQEKGIELIFQYSIQIHGDSAKEKEVLTDTTVAPKNITFPTDTKLQVKIIKECVKTAKKENILLRQTYTRIVKRCLLAQRFKNHPKNFKKAVKARKQIKTIAGRLVRELKRKMNHTQLKNYEEKLALFEKVLTQKKEDKNKIYSLHEREVYCIAKGKDHKPFEFGSKAAIVMTKKSGVIVGALDVKNRYDGHVLEDIILQTERLISRKPEVIIGDRGYKGSKEILGVKVLTPKPLKLNASTYEKRKTRESFRRRASIEPVIGHLKEDYGLKRCFLKGEIGNKINLLMACSVYNIKKYLKAARMGLKKLQKFLFSKKYLVFQG
jgi:IS5 family transposase